MDKDYRPISQNIVFESGSVEAECISVTIVNDETLENSESFFVLLESSSQFVVVDQALANITILDDDCKKFELSC